MEEETTANKKLQQVFEKLKSDEVVVTDSAEQKQQHQEKKYLLWPSGKTSFCLIILNYVNRAKGPREDRDNTGRKSYFQNSKTFREVSNYMTLFKKIQNSIKNKHRTQKVSQKLKI